VIVVSTPGTALSRELGEPPAGTRMIRWDVEGPAPEPRIDIVVMPYMRISENLPWLETVQSRLVQSQASPTSSGRPSAASGSRSAARASRTGPC
jgi:hypothetical protein